MIRHKWCCFQAVGTYMGAKDTPGGMSVGFDIFASSDERSSRGGGVVSAATHLSYIPASLSGDELNIFTDPMLPGLCERHQRAY